MIHGDLATESEVDVMEGSGFEPVLEQYHQALRAFQTGDAEPVLRLFSDHPEVTLANPFGGVARGKGQVAETARRAANLYRDGDATAFQSISKEVTPNLAYLVEVENYSTKVGGAEDLRPVALRVTSIFRREGSSWRLLHRHADSLVGPQKPSLPS